MDWQLIISILLTLAPVIELRGGLPVAIHYAISKGLPTFPIFFIIVILNILIIFPIFFFLDVIHHRLTRFKWYDKSANFFIERTQKKVDKVEKRMGLLGYFALALFVAVPLPGTGAYTGSLVSWILGLERKRAIPAIALGVAIAGLIIYAASLGLFKLI